jgi:hypothetical protein
MIRLAGLMVPAMLERTASDLPDERATLGEWLSEPLRMLASVLCDRERYIRVGEKIRPGYAALSRGDVVDIVTGKPAEEDSSTR